MLMCLRMKDEMERRAGFYVSMNEKHPENSKKPYLHDLMQTLSQTMYRRN